MKNAYRQAVADELALLGMKGCKVKQRMDSEQWGKVEITSPTTTVVFDLIKASGRWTCPYSPAQMANLFAEVHLTASYLKTPLGQLKWIVEQKIGTCLHETVIQCRVDFALSKKVTAVFYAPSIMLVCVNNRTGIPELSRWAELREASIAAINNFDVNEGELAHKRLHALIQSAKQALLMRILSNVVGALEEQAAFMGVPLLVGGDE